MQRIRFVAGMLATLMLIATAQILSTSPAAAAPAPRDPASGVRVSLSSAAQATQLTRGRTAAPAATAAAFSNAWIVNYFSGKCLDHSNGGTGLNAYVYTCHGGSNQTWYSSGSTIRDYYSFKCLDHSNGGTGLDAYVYSCHGGLNQSWYLVYYGAPYFAYEIVNSYSGKCLDHSDGGYGLHAYVYTCNGQDNQLWRFL